MHDTDLKDFVEVWIDQPEGGDVGAAVLEVFQFHQVKIQARDDVVMVGCHQANLNRCISDLTKGLEIKGNPSTLATTLPLLLVLTQRF